MFSVLAVAAATAVLLLPGMGTAPLPETIGADVVHTGADLADGSFTGTVVTDIEAVGRALTVSPREAAGTYESSRQEAGHAFNALGLHWLADTPDGAAVDAEVRFSRDGVEWGDWQKVSLIVQEGPDHIDETPSAGETIGELLYTDEARHFQYRLNLTANEQGEAPVVRKITASYIDAKGYHESPLSVDGAVRTISAWVDPPEASAAPNIISRAQWGANEAHMQWDPEYVPPKKIILHHTVTSNSDPDPAATVRSIYYYHAVSLGWGDIGYNFLVDRQGRIYEGRYGGNGVVGGHALTWNYGSVGISVLGDYTSSNITSASFQALVSLMVYKSNANQIDPTGFTPMLGTTKPNYLGHRDVGQTACPGSGLYARLPELRNAAKPMYSPVPIVGAILGKWESLGGAPGAALGTEYPVNDANGVWLGQAQNFNIGKLVWDQQTGGVCWVYGGIGSKYDQLAGAAGLLGMPRSDEYAVGSGRAADFANGKIYWSAVTDAREVHGGILGKYLVFGGPARFGFPTSDEYDVAGPAGSRASNFQLARIYFRGDSGGTYPVYGSILGRYLAWGGPAGLGLPTADENDLPGVPGGRFTEFDYGTIYWTQATDAHAVWTGPFRDTYAILGGPTGPFGLPVDDDFAASGGRAQNLQGATITWRNDLGAHAVYGGVRGKYLQMGGPTGYLGLATTDEFDVGAVPGARESDFDHGRIIWHASTNAHAVIGGINQLYTLLGGAATIGIPATDEFDIPGVPGGRESDFSMGRIYYHPAAGTNEVYGGILARYLQLGGPGGIMGMPVSGEYDIPGVTGARESDFQRGRVYFHPVAGTHEVYGGILSKYVELGGPAGILGMPVTGETDVGGVAGARQNAFQNGRIYWSSFSGEHAVYGGILMKYLEYGGPASALGMPVSDEYAHGSGRRSDFQGGYIHWDPATGAQVYIDADATVTADSTYEARDGNGALLATIGAGQTASVSYRDGIYTLNAPGVSHSGSSHIRFAAGGGVMQVTSYHDIPSWNTSLDDNRFRGAIEVRYSPVSRKVWIVNDLPMEHYLRGIAETSSSSPMEFLKTMTVSARSYAIWHLDRGGKHGSNEIFHLKNSRHGNGDDQVYKGYGLEARFPGLTTAVNGTAGQVVTYNGAVAMTAYFSNSDGRTRSAQEAWGVSYWPWLQSVPDPDCNGMTRNGHGVGLSGHGALARAGRGDSYASILGYYYTGTTISTVNTARNIRIAITSVD